MSEYQQIKAGLDFLKSSFVKGMLIDKYDPDTAYEISVADVDGKEKLAIHLNGQVEEVLFYSDLLGLNTKASYAFEDVDEGITLSADINIGDTSIFLTGEPANNIINIGADQYVLSFVKQVGVQYEYTVSPNVVTAQVSGVGAITRTLPTISGENDIVHKNYLDKYSINADNVVTTDKSNFITSELERYLHTLFQDDSKLVRIIEETTEYALTASQISVSDELNGTSKNNIIIDDISTWDSAGASWIKFDTNTDNIVGFVIKSDNRLSMWTGLTVEGSNDDIVYTPIYTSETGGATDYAVNKYILTNQDYRYYRITGDDSIDTENSITYIGLLEGSTWDTTADRVKNTANNFVMSATERTSFLANLTTGCINSIECAVSGDRKSLIVFGGDILVYDEQTQVAEIKAYAGSVVDFSARFGDFIYDVKVDTDTLQTVVDSANTYTQSPNSKDTVRLFTVSMSDVIDGSTDTSIYKVFRNTDYINKGNTFQRDFMRSLMPLKSSNTDFVISEGTSGLKLKVTGGVMLHDNTDIIEDTLNTFTQDIQNTKQYGKEYINTADYTMLSTCWVGKIPNASSNLELDMSYISDSLPSPSSSVGDTKTAVAGNEYANYHIFLCQDGRLFQTLPQATYSDLEGAITNINKETLEHNAIKEYSVLLGVITAKGSASTFGELYISHADRTGTPIVDYSTFKVSKFQELTVTVGQSIGTTLNSVKRVSTDVYELTHDLNTETPEVTITKDVEQQIVAVPVSSIDANSIQIELLDGADDIYYVKVRK